VAFFYADDAELARLILLFGRLPKKRRGDLLSHAEVLTAG